tara:strand:- start:330 stop:1118 length:789 start_codon:yes stop_codon:yes gene_type:complete
MIFNKIPDVCLQEIFLFVNDYVDIRMLQATAWFFNKDFSKDYVDEYIQKRKAFIQKYFPPLVISMVCGYNQILHYPIITNFSLRANRRLFSQETDSIPGPTFQEMKYPVMIGVYKEQAFISIIIKTTQLCVLGSHVPGDLQHSVLTIYSSGQFCRFNDDPSQQNHPEWKTNNNFLSPSFSPDILGTRNDGVFSILDQDFYNKMKNILTCENNTETLPIRTPYTYDKYIRFEVPNIPQYNKPLISSSIVSDNFDLNNFDLNTI